MEINYKHISKLKFFLLFLSVLFCMLQPFKIYGMPIRFDNEIAFMKVMISSSEFEYIKVNTKEYSINSRYYLNSTFVKGAYYNIVKKLESFKQKESTKPILLEYVKIGDGKRMVTNIAIP
jgi:hypothetical protein